MILMYHRVGEGKHSNSKETLFSHLKFLSHHYPIVLPGEALSPKEINICLTFDDALYDFYAEVFPLLQKLRIRALLGIPVKYILEKTSVSSKIRLAVPYYRAMEEGIYGTRAPFCTWEELMEMVLSGYTEPASHSFSHQNMLFEGSDDFLEVKHSKDLLERRLKRDISTFIYPFGRTNRKIQNTVACHYSFSMRIGGALNWGWGGSSRALCRFPADNLNDIRDLLRWHKRIQSYFKLMMNTICMK